MSLKDTKDAALLKLLTSLAKTLRHAYADLKVDVAGSELTVKGEFNVGGELLIIDGFISDIMEDDGLDFDAVIYLITAVHSIGREKID